MILIPKLLLLAAGLAVLIFGAEYLVRGAARLASRFGIPSLIIGLTVVAFGTSSPELAVVIRSGFIGTPEIALGNVVGSNIFNILFILGLSAVVRPIAVSRQLIKVDAPLMILASLLVFLLSSSGRLDGVDGAILFAGILGYITLLIVQSYRRRRKRGEHSAKTSRTFRSEAGHWAADLGFCALGLALLYLGSRWTLNSAVDIARNFGVSELVVGLTIIAIGTSLPEIATSIVASMHKEGDISVGNIVGSNIFNLLCVLGLAAICTPGGIPVSPHAFSVDLPVMVLCAIVCLPIFFTWNVISRWEGWLLFSYYIAYMVYLYLDTNRSPLLSYFDSFILYAAFPATAFVLLVTTYRAVRSAAKRPK